MAATATRTRKTSKATRPAPTAAQRAEWAESRQANLESAQQTLEAGVASLTGSTEWAAFLRATDRFRRYSLNNQILIWTQRPDATRVASYKTWQELGYQVRKGEQGISIFAPSTRKITDEEAREAGHPEIAGRVRVTGFRVVKTFDRSQVDATADAQPLEQPGAYTAPEGEAPEGLIAGLAEQIEAAGYRVEFTDQAGIDRFSSGAHGVTVFSQRLVAVREDTTRAHQAEILAHELAHITLGHEHRRDDPRSQREVEAESVAYAVCAHAGLDISCASFGYVAGWAEADKRAEVVRATAKLVLETAGAIVARLDGDEVTGEETVAA